MWEPWNLPVWAAWLLPLAASLVAAPLLVRLAAWLPWRMHCEWAWQEWSGLHVDGAQIVSALEAPAGSAEVGRNATDSNQVGSHEVGSDEAGSAEQARNDGPVLPPLVPLGTAARRGLAFASVVLALLCAWRFGVSWGAGAALVCCWALLLLAVIDMREMLLPDSLTQPLLWAGLLMNIGTAGWAPLSQAVLGAVAGYLSLWLLFHAFRLLTGREGMGYGDFKLLAALGAWVGLAALPQLILIAAVSGLAYGIWTIVTRRAGLRTAQPFGIHLAWAGVAMLLWMGAP